MLLSKPYRLDVEMYDCGFLERSRHPYVRRDRHYKGRHNLIARLPGTGGGRSLLLSGHMDTVPTRPNPWRDSPFSGVVRGSRLYGRGSWDMKSGLAAQFGVAMALRKGGVRLKGDLLCESVIDEEFGGGGGMLAGRLRGDNADACAIAEGTNHEVVRATRGGLVFDVVCQAGDPMAYFSKAEVVSPAIPLGRLLGWVDGWVKRRKTVERGATYAHFPDPAPVQVLAVESNRCDPDVAWSVPLESRVRVYFQFLPHEDVPRVMREIEESLRAFAAADRFFRVHPLARRAAVRSPAPRPRAPGRPSLDALPPRGGREHPGQGSQALGLRVALRRLPRAALLRDPHPALRASRRRQPQRQRVRGGAVGPADGRGLPGRRPRVVWGAAPRGLSVASGPESGDRHSWP